MTTDITELAQREKFEAWIMTQICISKSTLEGLRTAEGYRNSTLSGTDYNRLWSLYQSAASELVEALEKAQATEAHCNRGWSEAHEQEDRAEAAERRIAELDAELEREREKSRRVTSRIAELESRTVKLVDCDFGAVQHMSGGSTDYCHGFVDGTQNAIRAISAAGIKVEQLS